jgi:hypothetical protein
MKKQSPFEEILQIPKLMPQQIIIKTTFFWTYPISLSFAVLLTPTRIENGRELSLWLLIGFLAHSSMYPFVYYGQSKLKLSEQIPLVILMGITHGSTMSILAPILDLEDSLSLPVRILNSAIITFYWMLFAAVIIQYGKTLRDRLKVLLSEIIEKGIINLSKVTENSQSELLTNIAALQKKITDAVGEKPTKLQILQASSEIDLLINEYIRPLSQSKWKDGNITWVRMGLSSVIYSTLAKQKIPVIPVIVLVFPFSFVIAVSRIEFSNAIFPIVAFITMVVSLDCLLLSTIKEKDGYRNINLLFFTALIAFIFPVTYFIQAISFNSGISSAYPVKLNYIWTACVLILFFIIGTMLFRLKSETDFVFEFLSDVIKKGQLKSILKKSQADNFDNKFARYIHAEVQSQLLACKLLLLKAAESDFELFSPETLAQILERMGRIAAPYQSPLAKATNNRLPEIAQAWKGLAEIEYELIPELAEFNSQSEIISQLIEEAVINAIRHGKASKVSIIAKATNSAISVSIRDNGSLDEAEVGSGLGTILLNSFADSWTLERVEEQSLLTFSVSFGRSFIS